MEQNPQILRERIRKNNWCRLALELAHRVGQGGSQNEPDHTHHPGHRPAGAPQTDNAVRTRVAATSAVMTPPTTAQPAEEMALIICFQRSEHDQSHSSQRIGMGLLVVHLLRIEQPLTHDSDVTSRAIDFAKEAAGNPSWQAAPPTC